MTRCARAPAAGAARRRGRHRRRWARALKPGMLRLRDLRNQVVELAGLSRLLQLSGFRLRHERGRDAAAQRPAGRELRPLYRELHTWARYELAKRYGVPVPDELAGALAAQPMGAGLGLAGRGERASMWMPRIAPTSAEWVVRQAEAFYRSLGFDSLPSTFLGEFIALPAAGGRALQEEHPRVAPGTSIWTTTCARS